MGPAYGRFPLIGPVLLKFVGWRNLRKPWLQSTRESEEVLGAEMSFRWSTNREQFAERMGVPLDQADEKFRELMTRVRQEIIMRMMVDHKVGDWDSDKGLKF